MEKTELLINNMKAGQSVFWRNAHKRSWESVCGRLPFTEKDILDARRRLERFAPFLEVCFPETREQGGRIQSPLKEIPSMKKRICGHGNAEFSGRLFVKLDSHLAVAGSVKARGGIYEVLKHTEELAFAHGILSLEDNYAKLAGEEARRFFQKFTIQVGSTGNLGLSIGIASAAIGYRVIVHMSADAKQWKKDMLRAHGVTVMEYKGDYGEAVKNGRARSEQDSSSYFVDDENSENLFLGYSAAGAELAEQLRMQNVTVDKEHPLVVYIPCGVGGAPGGITFGLKQIFKDDVYCYFVEPVQSPCMLLGMATGLHSQIAVQDIGLSGKTHADGLAVGRASGFIGKIMEPLLDGIITVQDYRLYHEMRNLLETEDIFMEPSACAAFGGVRRGIFKEQYPETKEEQAVHVAWATGGSLVPEQIREEYKNTFLEERK